jgi:hypothetical protein
VPTGLSRRISSAYGTHDLGRYERRPVVGDEYGAGTAGLSGCAASTACLDSRCLVPVVEVVAFSLDVTRWTGCSWPCRMEGLGLVVVVTFHLRV